MDDGDVRDGGVAVLMSELSEDVFCAGWLIGLEFELWARVEQFRLFAACSGWGFADAAVMNDRVRELVNEVDVSGVWACWDGAASRVVVVPVEDWEVLFWASASPEDRELAGSAPTCGARGDAVPDGESPFRVWFPPCVLPAGHDGDHVYAT